MKRKFELEDARVAGVQQIPFNKISIMGPVKDTKGEWVEIEISVEDAQHLQEWFNEVWPTK